MWHINNNFISEAFPSCTGWFLSYASYEQFYLNFTNNRSVQIPLIMHLVAAMSISLYLLISTYHWFAHWRTNSTKVEIMSNKMDWWMLLLVSCIFSCQLYSSVLIYVIYRLPTGTRVHFMAHLGKHWTQTPVLEIKRRMCYLEIELSIKYVLYFKLLILTFPYTWSGWTKAIRWTRRIIERLWLRWGKMNLKEPTSSWLV